MLIKLWRKERTESRQKIELERNKFRDNRLRQCSLTQEIIPNPGSRTVLTLLHLHLISFISVKLFYFLQTTTEFATSNPDCVAVTHRIMKARKSCSQIILCNLKYLLQSQKTTEFFSFQL